MIRSRIREVLRERGQKQSWFCQALGIHPAYFWQMDAGQRPWQPDLMDKAARLMKVPKGRLFYDDGVSRGKRPYHRRRPV